jgi:GTPase Era involved in 16S rRNA processing
MTRPISELKQIVKQAQTAEEILQHVNSASFHLHFTEEARNRFYTVFAQKTVNFYQDDDFSDEEKREIVLTTIRETVQRYM